MGYEGLTIEELEAKKAELQEELSEMSNGSVEQDEIRDISNEIQRIDSIIRDIQLEDVRDKISKAKHQEKLEKEYQDLLKKQEELQKKYERELKYVGRGRQHTIDFTPIKKELEELEKQINAKKQELEGVTPELSTNVNEPVIQVTKIDQPASAIESPAEEVYEKIADPIENDENENVEELGDNMEETKTYTKLINNKSNEDQLAKLNSLSTGVSLPKEKEEEKEQKEIIENRAARLDSLSTGVNIPKKPEVQEGKSASTIDENDMDDYIDYLEKASEPVQQTIVEPKSSPVQEENDAKKNDKLNLGDFLSAEEVNNLVSQKLNENKEGKLTPIENNEQNAMPANGDEEQVISDPVSENESENVDVFSDEYFVNKGIVGNGELFDIWNKEKTYVGDILYEAFHSMTEEEYNQFFQNLAEITNSPSPSGKLYSDIVGKFDSVEFNGNGVFYYEKNGDMHEIINWAYVYKCIVSAYLYDGFMATDSILNTLGLSEEAKNLIIEDVEFSCAIHKLQQLKNDNRDPGLIDRIQYALRNEDISVLSTIREELTDFDIEYIDIVDDLIDHYESKENTSELKTKIDNFEEISVMKKDNKTLTKDSKFNLNEDSGMSATVQNAQPAQDPISVQNVPGSFSFMTNAQPVQPQAAQQQPVQAAQDPKNVQNVPGAFSFMTSAQPVQPQAAQQQPVQAAQDPKNVQNVPGAFSFMTNTQQATTNSDEMKAKQEEIEKAEKAKQEEKERIKAERKKAYDKVVEILEPEIKAGIVPATELKKCVDQIYSVSYERGIAKSEKVVESALLFTLDLIKVNPNLPIISPIEEFLEVPKKTVQKRAYFRKLDKLDAEYKPTLNSLIHNKKVNTQLIKDFLLSSGDIDEVKEEVLKFVDDPVLFYEFLNLTSDISQTTKSYWKNDFEDATLKSDLEKLSAKAMLKALKTGKEEDVLASIDELFSKKIIENLGMRSRERYVKMVKASDSLKEELMQRLSQVTMSEFQALTDEQINNINTQIEEFTKQLTLIDQNEKSIKQRTEQCHRAYTGRIEVIDKKIEKLSDKKPLTFEPNLGLDENRFGTVINQYNITSYVPDFAKISDLYRMIGNVIKEGVDVTQIVAATQELVEKTNALTDEERAELDKIKQDNDIPNVSSRKSIIQAINKEIDELKEEKAGIEKELAEKMELFDKLGSDNSKGRINTENSIAKLREKLSRNEEIVASKKAVNSENNSNSVNNENSAVIAGTPEADSLANPVKVTRIKKSNKTLYAKTKTPFFKPLVQKMGETATAFINSLFEEKEDDDKKSNEEEAEKILAEQEKALGEEVAKISNNSGDFYTYNGQTFVAGNESEFGVIRSDLNANQPSQQPVQQQPAPASVQGVPSAFSFMTNVQPAQQQPVQAAPTNVQGVPSAFSFMTNAQPVQQQAAQPASDPTNVQSASAPLPFMPGQSMPAQQQPVQQQPAPQIDLDNLTSEQFQELLVALSNDPDEDKTGNKKM